MGTPYPGGTYLNFANANFQYIVPMRKKPTAKDGDIFYGTTYVGKVRIVTDVFAYKSNERYGYLQSTKEFNNPIIGSTITYIRNMRLSAEYLD